MTPPIGGMLLAQSDINCRKSSAIATFDWYTSTLTKGHEILDHLHSAGLISTTSRGKNYILGSVLPHPRADGPADAAGAAGDEVGNVLSKYCGLHLLGATSYVKWLEYSKQL